MCIHDVDVRHAGLSVLNETETVYDLKARSMSLFSKPKRDAHEQGTSRLAPKQAKNNDDHLGGGNTDRETSSPGEAAHETSSAEEPTATQEPDHRQHGGGVQEGVKEYLGPFRGA